MTATTYGLTYAQAHAQQMAGEPGRLTRRQLEAALRRLGVSRPELPAAWKHYRACLCG